MKKLILCASILLICAWYAVADNPHVPRGPVIVSEVDLTAETGNFGPTTIFTPTAAGLYRVTVYGEASASNNGSCTVNLDWQDDYATNQRLVTNEGFPCSGSRTVFSIAGSPFQIISGVSLPNGGTYNLSFIIEQL
jgi:hypothetical protein